jgi:hypothetical protein
VFPANNLNWILLHNIKVKKRKRQGIMLYRKRQKHFHRNMVLIPRLIHFKWTLSRPPLVAILIILSRVLLLEVHGFINVRHVTTWDYQVQ